MQLIPTERGEEDDTRRTGRVDEAGPTDVGVGRPVAVDPTHQMVDGSRPSSAIYSAIQAGYTRGSEAASKEPSLIDRNAALRGAIAVMSSARSGNPYPRFQPHAFQQALPLPGVVAATAQLPALPSLVEALGGGRVRLAGGGLYSDIISHYHLPMKC